MTTWVLLRGWARESRHWGDFIPALQARIPASDRVLTLDLPGNGSLHTEASPLRIADMVERLRVQLGRIGESGPFTLVALSMGGMAAIHWASVHPQEIAGCALINTSARGLGPFWWRMRPGSWGELLGIARERDPQVREARIVALTSRRADAAAVARQWARFAHERPTSVANALRQIVAAALFRLPARAPAAPLLLVCARHDGLVSAHCSEALARHWHLPLRMHGWAGHDVALDDPAWLIDAILAWHEALP